MITKLNSRNQSEVSPETHFNGSSILVRIMTMSIKFIIEGFHLKWLGAQSDNMNGISQSQQWQWQSNPWENPISQSIFFWHWQSNWTNLEIWRRKHVKVHAGLRFVSPDRCGQRRHTKWACRLHAQCAMWKQQTNKQINKQISK